MTKKFALNILMAIWLSVALLLFGALLIQTYGQKYGSEEELRSAWKWGLDATSTPLAFIITAALTDSPDGWGSKKAKVFGTFLAFLVSGLYLLSLIGVMLFEPMTGQRSGVLFEITGMGTSLWQAVVFSALTYFILGDR